MLHRACLGRRRSGWRLPHLRDLVTKPVYDICERRFVADFKIARPRKIHTARFHDAAGTRAHHMHGVGKKHRLTQVMRHQYNGEAEPLPHIAQDAPQFFARKRVERGKGLVQHQQLRLVDQRAAQGRALLHAAGQLPRIAAAEPGEADRVEQLFGARDVFGLFRAEVRAVGLDDFQRQQDIIEHRAPRQHVGVLERHAGHLHRPAHRSAGDFNDAARRLHQSGHQFHQRGLAASGRPDHGGEFAAPTARLVPSRASTGPVRPA